MSSLDKQSSHMEPSSSIGRTQSGLAALFVMPSPKKRMEKLTELLMTNPISTRGSRWAQRLQKMIRTMVQVQKKTDGNGNQVIDYKPFVDKRKPSWWRRREGDGVVVVCQKNRFMRVHAIFPGGTSFFWLPSPPRINLFLCPSFRPSVKVKRVE